jgi:hypothetical protein
MGLDRAHPEVARPARRENIAKPKWAEIYIEARYGLGKAHAMAKHKIGPPINMHVVRVF